MTKEELEKEYIDNKKSIAQIAIENNLSSMTIHQYLKKFNIQTRKYGEHMKGKIPPNSIFPKKEIIEQWLKDGGISLIVEKTKVNKATVYIWLKKYNISPPRFQNEKPDKKELEEKYSLLKSFRKLAKHYHTTPYIVKDWLKFYDIQIHSGPHAWKGMPKEQLLEEMKNKSFSIIAKENGVTFPAIKTLCKKYGIDINPTPHKITNLPTEEIKSLYTEKKHTLNEIGEKYNVSSNVIKRYLEEENVTITPSGFSSAAEREIQEYIISLGFVAEKKWFWNGTKKIEYDIVVEDKKIMIEYCGLYWHSENPSHGLNRGKYYHHEKYVFAENLGYRLITIFEDEWKYRKNQIKAFLSSSLGIYDNRIFARKCNILNINNDIAKDFFEQYHWQGGKFLQIQKACGITYNDELLGIMSFGLHHRNNKQLTLNRLCFKSNQQVIGGASRMFSFLKKEFQTSIISWSDNRYSQGNVYNALNFQTEEHLDPDYDYTNGRIRKSKQSMKKSATKCPENKTEKQWNYENGWYRIWNCGKIRWIYS